MQSVFSEHRNLTFTQGCSSRLNFRSHPPNRRQQIFPTSRSGCGIQASVAANARVTRGDATTPCPNTDTACPSGPARNPHPVSQPSHCGRTILDADATRCQAGEASDITSKVFWKTNENGTVSFRMVTTYRGKEKVMMELFRPNAQEVLTLSARSYLAGGHLVLTERDKHKSGRLDTLAVYSPGTNDMEVFARQADGSVKPVSTQTLETYKKGNAAVNEFLSTMFTHTNASDAEFSKWIEKIQSWPSLSKTWRSPCGHCRFGNSSRNLLASSGSPSNSGNRSGFLTDCGSITAQMFLRAEATSTVWSVPVVLPQSLQSERVHFLKRNTTHRAWGRER